MKINPTKRCFRCKKPIKHFSTKRCRRCHFIYSRGTNHPRYKHGIHNTPEFNLWNHIKARCFNPNEIGFKNYGGRGITMDKRWRFDFLSFFNDVGHRPSPKHSIDRINNNGNYEPGNVRWATRFQQANNTRRNHLIEWNGQKHSIAEWARIIGIGVQTFHSRLRIGWSIEKILTTPALPLFGIIR